MAQGLSCSALPGPGIEPVSLALAGRFFTTEPLGKPSISTFLWENLWIHFIISRNIHFLIAYFFPNMVQVMFTDKSSILL